MKLTPLPLHPKSVLILFVLLCAAPSMAKEGYRHACDGLPDDALTHAEMAAAPAEVDAVSPSESHIAACTKALDQKAMPIDSPRRLNLLRAKLVGALMLGHDFNSDRLLIDRAQYQVLLEGAALEATRRSAKVPLPIVIPLNAPYLSPAEIEEYRHSARLIDILLLNRQATPDRARLDTAFEDAAAKTSPFTIGHYRDLVELASVSPVLSTAERSLYLRFAHLTGTGRLALANAYHVAGNDDDAFEFANLMAIYFESERDLSSLVAGKTEPDHAGDLSDQSFRIDVAGIMADILVTSQKATPDQRVKWLSRAENYALVLGQYLRSKAIEKEQIWDKIPLSQATVKASVSYNILQSATTYNQKQFTLSQNSLKRSLTCSILNEQPCYSPAKARLAQQLLTQEFVEKDGATLAVIATSMAPATAHKRAYLDLFRSSAGIPAWAKRLVANPIGRSGALPAMAGAKLYAEPSDPKAALKNGLSILLILDQPKFPPYPTLQRTWALAAATAQKQKLSHIALSYWQGDTQPVDAALRRVFKQKPEKSNVFQAVWIAYNADEQDEKPRLSLQSVSFPVDEILKNLSLSDEEKALVDAVDLVNPE